MSRPRQTKDPFAEPLVIASLGFALAMVFAAWPIRILIILVGAAAFGIGYWIYLRRLRFRRLVGIDDIDMMSGEAFERRLWLLFRDLGYQVEATPLRGDWGADLVIRKNGECAVVQAKRYGKPVGVGAVQEVVAAQAKYGCAQAIVVTNASFTRAAEVLAFHNRVELWDRERLIAELGRTLRPVR